MSEYDNLPAQMRAAKRWLVWRQFGSRKVPFYASGAARAATDTPEDAALLATFDDALAVVANYTGLAFALGPDGTGNHWQGVDLDKLSERPVLQLLAEDLPGYTETSPSGNGRHAIGYGRAFATLGSNATGIEAYSGGRFFTVTGEGAGLAEPRCLADFVECTLRPKHSPVVGSVVAHAAEIVTPAQVTELRSALTSMRADDRDTWVGNGQRLKNLGDVGRGLWLEWSQTSDKYDPADAARCWESFTADRTGYAAVFKAAQSVGWVNPASNAATVTKKTASPPQIKTAASLLGQQFAPVQWGVRGILPEGVSILSGDPKIGKSWLLYQATIAVAGGRPLWPGREAEIQGDALMLALEDNDRRLQRRLQTLMPRFMTPGRGTKFEYPTLERLHYATEWPRAEAGVDQLIAWLRAHPKCRLVVVDTVSAFRQKDLAKNKSAYAADYEVGEMFKPLAREFSCAIVLVMHNRKAASNDALQLVSGTQGMTGGVDNVLVMKRERGHMDAGLYVDGRDIEEPQELALRFDNGFWSSDGRSVDETRMSRERREMMDAVARLGSEAKAKRLADEFPHKQYKSIRSLLAKMVRAGDLTLDAHLYSCTGTVGTTGTKDAA